MRYQGEENDRKVFESSSSSHPPPRNIVELLRRNTSRTAQETTNSLQISYKSTYIYKNGADISFRT